MRCYALPGWKDIWLMRKKTLASVAVMLSIATVLLLKVLAAHYTFEFPFFGNVSPILAFILLGPLLLIALGVLNKYVLAWRKARGRDIEEEEKHEFEDSDIISLRPRQPHETSSTYRRWDDHE